MKSIILCAGYGTRMYPLTKDTPKALLPIRGKPVLSYIADKLQLIDGISEIIVVTNDKFYTYFQEWLNNYPSRIPVVLINNGSKNHKDRRGAVGDLAFVIKTLRIDDDVLVIGGDNLFDFSLSEFIKHSLNLNPNPVIGIYNLNGRNKAKKYGVVKTDLEGRVIDFYEKPSHLNGSSLVSLCLYYLPKQTLPSLDTYIENALRTTRYALRTTHDAIRDTQYAIRDTQYEIHNTRYALRDTHDALDSIGNYIRWLVKNHKVYGYKFSGNWFDIGDIDSYTEAVCSF